MRHTIATILAILTSLVCQALSYPAIQPSGTFKYAERDSVALYLDWYRPADGSITEMDGVRKPTVVFMFGGGFKEGERSNGDSNRWFKMLADNGFTVVSIDYRLGLKGVGNAGVNANFIKALDHAIQIAVEDLYSATNYLISNAEALGIDPAAIVISGSSAGAISVMQAEWELCNGHGIASVLPEGFNYAGVMSFSGAILSHEGAVKYTRREPCPTLILHGTADNTVPYKQIAFLSLRFAGSSVIAKTFEKIDGNYRFYRFEGNGHEIAGNMRHNFKEELDFLEHNVMKGEKKVIDAVVCDPTIIIPDWAKGLNYKDLYD